jgi:hypothetical protein
VSFPSYPPGLDEPDFTFYQPNIPMLILAWRDPSDPQDLLMSLYILPSDSPWIAKYDPDIIEETSVDGQYALWVEGLHLLELDTGDFTHRRLVEGATLLWQVGGVTYRLESGLPMEEAIRVAESLEPLEP